MKVIIHAGMHKTGSSSIQSHFGTTKYDGLTYARWESVNHSALFVLLFWDPDKAAHYHSFRVRGPEFCSTLPQLRSESKELLIDDMNSLGGNTLLFSAEDISSYGIGKPANPRMAEFFRRWTTDITVMAYVRAPRSFAVSAFQQRLKGPVLRKLNIATLFRNYRASVSQLDDAYGASSVLLKPYARELLINGDVVQDFAAFLQLKMNELPQVESNTTLSAEATALLYVQRRLGKGFVAGFPNANRANRLFIDSLRPVGGSKMGFADSLWNPVLEARKADLDWIEKRIGQPLPDAHGSGEVEIASEQDLFDLAVASEGALRAVIPEALHNHDPDPLTRVNATLEALRQHCYKQVLLRPNPVAKSASL
jgi:hypothetical protein